MIRAPCCVLRAECKHELAFKVNIILVFCVNIRVINLYYIDELIPSSKYK